MSEDEVTRVNSEAPVHGSTMGPWLVLERIDFGSYGVVFRAQRAGHPEAGSFALKRAKQAGDPRFEREAELLQLVQHPSVPRYEDSGNWTSPEGYRYPYLVMEWVEGFTLYDWFREAPRSTREVLHVLAQVARGLEAVHAAGAVHRDLKGDNIRVTSQGRAVLLDFGSGWWPGARPLTDTVVAPGTTRYRAPELLRFMWRFYGNSKARWQARPSDDLYSLGVTAYRLVTGAYLPPVMESEEEEPRKLLRPRELATVAPELENIILRLLSEEREARGTTREVAESIERAAQAAGPEADRPILPSSAAAPTEQGAPRRSSRAPPSSQSSRSRPAPVPVRPALRGVVPAWLSWASAAMVGGILVVLATELRQQRNTAFVFPSQPQEWHMPPVETPDAGVGDVALASAQDIPRVEIPTYALALPMPKQPFPGQRKPPCDPTSEVLALGACWWVLKKEPPCGGAGYDHDGQCVVPILPTGRQPTSEEP